MIKNKLELLELVRRNFLDLKLMKCSMKIIISIMLGSDLTG